MKKYILLIIFILWNALHVGFLYFNQILKIADSFAYLQMASYLQEWLFSWFWTWWFGFLYSLPIAFLNFATHNDMFSAFIVNILFFNFLVWLCYLLGKNYLSAKYNYLFLILIFLSPILLHYNINILSENIYITLFLILFVWVLKFREMPILSNSIFIWMILALLYFTRSEAFIYIGSVWLIYLFLLFTKQIRFETFLSSSIFLIISFFAFASPYLYYLHWVTWEWWLTNKWSANLRQAELRWTSKMDDDGFEQAVWELTADNTKLIAWFAWGLKYEKWEETQSFKDYLLNNHEEVLNRFWVNQAKLYTNNLPNIIIWNSFQLYSVEWNKIFYQNMIYLWIILLMLPLIIFWIIMMIRNWEAFFVFSFLSFFLTASVFFTLFFVLDRYFVIFVPLFIFFMVYWSQKIFDNYSLTSEISKYIFFFLFFISIYSLWNFSYFNTIKWQDAIYEVKKEAWVWLKENFWWEEIKYKIMERFPVVTYYSGTKERWLTPYTDKLENVVAYARYNDLDYLVVDSLDFAKYRSDLWYLLTDSNKRYNWIVKLKEFEKNWEKVVLYKVVK